MKARVIKVSVPYMVVMFVMFSILSVSNIIVFETVKKHFLNLKFFTLKNVSVQGNNWISSESVLRSANLSVGSDKISCLIPSIIARRVRSLSSHIMGVEVRRTLFGNSVTFVIKERQPKAFVLVGRDLFIVVDEQGVILDRHLEQAEALKWYGNKPIIVEQKPQAKCFRTKFGNLSVITSKGFATALNILKVLEPHGISMIDARDLNDIQVILKDHKEVKLSVDNLEDGLTNVCLWLNRFGHAHGKYQCIDARFPKAVYVR